MKKIFLLGFLLIVTSLVIAGCRGPQAAQRLIAGQEEGGGSLPGNDSGNQSYCGDGLLDAPETCDCGSPWDCYDGNGYDLGNFNCSDFGYDNGTLDCYIPGHIYECTFDVSGCVVENQTGNESYCGDGVINNGEQCDGDNWGNVTDCTDFDDYTGGTLTCTDECIFDTSACYQGPGCFGTPTTADCSIPEFTEDECDAVNNCIWHTSPPTGCSGTIHACETQSHEACSYVPGCIWIP